jgi:hypothetical protein
MVGQSPMVDVRKIQLTTLEEVREAIRETRDPYDDPTASVIPRIVRFKESYMLGDAVKLELAILTICACFQDPYALELLAPSGLRALFEQP